jgi:hypothetical protein
MNAAGELVICPSCDEAIDPEMVEPHFAGLDEERPECGRQDIAAIKARRERVLREEVPVWREIGDKFGGSLSTGLPRRTERSNMAGDVEKVMGPKVSKDRPEWPSGVGVGLIPISANPNFMPWPFVEPKNVSNLLPNKSGDVPAK